MCSILAEKCIFPPWEEKKKKEYSSGKSKNASGRNEEKEASQLFRGPSLIATGFGRLLGLWHVVSLSINWEPRLI